jgi:hypothetical protein
MEQTTILSSSIYQLNADKLLGFVNQIFIKEDMPLPRIGTL